MPGVPRRDPNPLGTAPLPGARVAADVPLAAVGLPARPNVAPLQQQLEQFVARERQKADTTALLDSDNQLAKLQTDLHTQARTLRGRDAVDATRRASDTWLKGVSEIEAKLSTDQQRQAFARTVGQRWQTLYNAIETHAANEADQYAVQTKDAALETRLNHAVEFYQDPGAIAGAVDETKMILNTFGQQEGWSREQLASETARHVTQIHAGVLDRLIANHQDTAAADYLTEHRDEMTGKELLQAESLVGRASVLGVAMRSSDEILKTATSLKAGLAAAAQLADPNVREETEQRIRRAYQDRADEQREARLQNESAATQIVRKHGYDAVPERILQQLTGDQIIGLKNLEARLRQGVDDPETVAALNNMAGLHPDQFAGLDLVPYRAALSKSTYDKLASKQVTMRQGEYRQAQSTRQRQAKELRTLQADLDQLGAVASDSAMAPFLAPKRARVQQLRDSLGLSRPSGLTTPVPGGPLKPTPPPPAGSGGPAPAMLPRLTPVTPRPPDDSDGPAVPAAWLDHAEHDPDYAAYLATMGVAL